MAIIQDEYDYIVCGGGTSGCVVAGRLAENSNLKILVVEAGSDGKTNENIKMIGGLFKLFGSESDWNIFSTPMKGVNGRQIMLNRGKFLGGSSGINGSLCIRGVKQDYDDWDLPGWSGEEMFHYMRKSEDFHKKDWFKDDEAAHGYGGPLHIEPHDMAPISQLMLKSMEDQGLPFLPDMFSTGESPHASGHAPRTVHKGLRSTGADFVSGPYERSNIDILCDTMVDKVNLDNTMRVVSVDVVDKSGSRRTVKARKEIILSAGAYCSPAILLRSGIGPRDELQKLGIECLLNSPGVGKNLLDHLICLVYYEVSKENLTNDHLLTHANAMEQSYLLYQKDKTGVLSTFPFGAFAFARLDDRLQDEPLWQQAKRTSGRDPMGLTPLQPHVEFMSTELYGPIPYEGVEIEKKQAFAVITQLFSPRSSGFVTLKSADPFENPVVDNNFLNDPLDLLVLTEGMRYGNEIVMQGAGTKDVVKGSWPPGRSHHMFTTREEWVHHARSESTTGYHPCGTCKMGKDDDRMAVLDEKLQVRGVKGLRVADCSVMPTLNSGHTQMPAYGIGEKAADLIKEAAGYPLGKKDSGVELKN